MDSEDDIQPLIQYEGGRDLYLELNAQLINADPEFEQVKKQCSLNIQGFYFYYWNVDLVAAHLMSMT